jgi:hypothetical protein
MVNEEFWKAHFPKTAKELDNWTPVVKYRALAMKVLCAATTRAEGTWAAYINAVPGQFHDLEYNDVLRWGDKLPEETAKTLFSEFEGVPYAH